MKYNIIGDIHGLSVWKKLVKKDHINIFVGDYFSPYLRLKKRKDVKLPKGFEENMSYIDKESKEIDGLMEWYDIYMPSFEEQRDNFLEIMEYKKQNPDTTILLVGNHDEDHWHICERYSRHDSTHCRDIRQLFEEFKDYFQIAYNIENKAIVSHAGISAFWYENMINDDFMTLDRIAMSEAYMRDNPDADIKQAHKDYFKALTGNVYDANTEDMWNHRCDAIIDWKDGLYRYYKETDEYKLLNYKVSDVVKKVNKLWKEGKYTWFNFRSNSDNFDGYGYSKTHGPLWVRDKTIVLNNLFKHRNVKQFVGHTQHSRVLYIEQVGFVDCLQYATQTLGYDSEKDRVYRYEGRRKPVDITDEFKN